MQLRACALAVYYFEMGTYCATSTLAALGTYRNARPSSPSAALAIAGDCEDEGQLLFGYYIVSLGVLY